MKAPRYIFISLVIVFLAWTTLSAITDLLFRYVTVNTSAIIGLDYLAVGCLLFVYAVLDDVTLGMQYDSRVPFWEVAELCEDFSAWYVIPGFIVCCIIFWQGWYLHFIVFKVENGEVRFPTCLTR